MRKQHEPASDVAIGPVDGCDIRAAGLCAFDGSAAAVSQEPQYEILDPADKQGMDDAALEYWLFEATRMYMARFGFDRTREQSAYSLIIAGNREANKWQRS